MSKPFFMTDIQKLKLKNYLQKPIKHFDIIIDDSKRNEIGGYFGELAFKDPISGDIHVIDTHRQYCLPCIQFAQRQDPSTVFEESGICFFNSRGNSNYQDHLKIRHQVMSDFVQPTYQPESILPKPSATMITVVQDEENSSDDGKIKEDQNSKYSRSNKDDQSINRDQSIEDEEKNTDKDTSKTGELIDAHNNSIDVDTNKDDGNSKDSFVTSNIVD